MNLNKLNLNPELSYRDIADELGCSDFTVMKIEKQALAKLREILDNHGLSFDDIVEVGFDSQLTALGDYDD